MSSVNLVIVGAKLIRWWESLLSLFRNPVLSGQNPDPSICAADGWFYIVTSSFAYFPAIPVHRSRDLVNWELLGHVLDRAEQVDLSGLPVGLGIWAPTIRYHDGVFYVVSTVAHGPSGSVNFITTARDPAGPWTQPVVLDAEGIDPSLFFDDDGRCWFTACRDTDNASSTGPADLYMRELDLATLQLIGPLHVLWNGAMAGAWAEAPHLYKRDGVYHLVAAEGGTERNHAVTAARSQTVTGPFRTDPRSPLLTHRHLGESAPIHNVGHADLVETPAGETWAVVLGTRPLAGHHTLGREVFLVPAEWTSAGLLLAPGRGTVTELERRPLGLEAEAKPDAPQPTRETFDEPGLPLSWRGLRGPIPGLAGGGGLRLPLSAERLSGTGTPSFAARRQEHQCFEVRTAVAFTPQEIGERAGLVVFQHDQRFATLSISVDGEGRRIVALEQVGVPMPTARLEIGSEQDVLLRVIGDASTYAFSYWDPAAEIWLPVGAVDRRWFSTESAGGFTGVNLGVHAAGNASSTGHATFRWFEYAPLPQLVPGLGDGDPAVTVLSHTHTQAEG